MCKHFKVNTLTALGVDDFMAGQIAAGAVLAYLYETQKNSLSNITHLNPYIASKYMLLDSATRRNLELTETLREKQKKVPCYGCWIRLKQPWAQDCSVLIWNSR